MSAAKSSRQFFAKFPGTCSVSGQRFAAGARVQFHNDRVALVDAVAGTLRAPTQASPKAVAVKAQPKKDDGRPGRRPVDARLDGQCRFCRSTPVTSCPMCGWKQQAQAVAVQSPPPPAAEAQPVAKGVTKADLITAIRVCDANLELNLCATLIAGLAGGPKKMARANTMAQIDAHCAQRGYIREDEVQARDAMVADCIRELGYDPRTEDGPAPVKVDQNAWVPKDPPMVWTVEAKALPAQQGPLKAGDWKQLWVMVQAGQLTEEEAKQFGQLWQSLGL